MFVNDNNAHSLLCEYLKKDVHLPFDTNTVFYIPFLPMNVGMFFIKVIIKFISDSRLHEIEIKRFVFKLNIIHSVTFNINIQFTEYNLFMRKMIFDIKVNCFIKNYKQLTSINYKDVLYNKFKWKLFSCNEWYAINNDVNAYEKYYNTYSMIYDINQVHNKKVVDLFKENVFNESINKDDNYESIAKSVNGILGKGNFIVIPFSVKDVEHNEIKCVYYKRIDINVPVMDAVYFKQLVKDVITINAVKEDKMENDIETYITLSVSINKNESLNGVIYSFTVEPILTDNNFEWIGLYTWECVYNVLTDINTPYKEEFIFSTLHKGVINVNKLQFTVHTQFGIFNIGIIGGAIYVHI